MHSQPPETRKESHVDLYATNNHLYAPINLEVLAQAIANRAWTSGAFAGSNQWKASGRQVRGGEKGTPVIMFVDKAIAKDGQEEKIKVRKVKYVFNIDQTEPVAAVGAAT